MKKDQNIIYGLIDPRDDQIRYVGKTEKGKSRLTDHLKPSSLNKDNSRKNNWIKSLLRQELKPTFEIIEVLQNPYDLFEAEAFWIEFFKYYKIELYNSTVGGLGTRGYKHRAESIELMKQKMQNRDNTNYQIPHNRRQVTIMNEIEHIPCCHCKELKSKDSFSILTRKHKNFHDSYCKSCRVSLNEGKYEKYYQKLSPEVYKQSRIDAAKAGAQALWSNPNARQLVSKARSKPIQGKSTTTDEILTFNSALEAKQYGFNNTNLGQAIKFSKPYKGYNWKFI